MAPYGHLINLCKERGKEGREGERKRGEEGGRRMRRCNEFSIKFQNAR